MPDFDLLRKTELRIERIRLKNANLTDIAACVADELGLDSDDVLVVDYSAGALTLDILDSCVNAYHFVGKRDLVLEKLGSLPGVGVSEETDIKSNGMLGWIALDEDQAKQALRESERMVSQIREQIAKRGIVFSSGAEVAEKQIEDTNTPTVVRHLEKAGYTVTCGETLRDDTAYMAAKLREAADNGGYGVIVTTGGVGAEAKDNTVEAVKLLDPEAATPYICHFQIGTGRHVKDGIKIAVGRYHDTLIVALPGPNDEVKASLDILVEGLKARHDKSILAETIARNLRTVLRGKTSGHHMHHPNG